MEARVQQKIDEHMRDFKIQMRDWLVNQQASVIFGTGSDAVNMTGEFLQFMFDHENIQLQKEDFQRRKRVKNHVPVNERCCAKRANGEQCTRRRLEGTFCGTHSKGAPHGVIDENELNKQPSMGKVEIWLQVIQGINYYVDEKSRIYSPEDIVSNKSNPRIIGHFTGDLSEPSSCRLVLQ